MMNKLVFDEDKHEYTIGGRRIPSVTEIVAPILSDSYKVLSPQIMQNAARRGTRVHEITQLIDYGCDIDELEIEPELAGYINAYLKFLRTYNPEWDAIEQPVHYCEEYAGTIDRAGLICGEQWIVDFKTVSSMDRAHRIALTAQLSGYQKAYAQGRRMPRRAGLLLKSDGSFTLYKAADIERKLMFNGQDLFNSLKEICYLKGGYEI